MADTVTNNKITNKLIAVVCDKPTDSPITAYPIHKDFCPVRHRPTNHNRLSSMKRDEYEGDAEVRRHFQQQRWLLLIYMIDYAIGTVIDKLGSFNQPV